jgi:hypothetical protein
MRRLHKIWTAFHRMFYIPNVGVSKSEAPGGPFEASGAGQGAPDNAPAHDSLFLASSVTVLPVHHRHRPHPECPKEAFPLEINLYPWCSIF